MSEATERYHHTIIPAAPDTLVRVSSVECGDASANASGRMPPGAYACNATPVRGSEPRRAVATYPACPDAQTRRPVGGAPSPHVCSLTNHGAHIEFSTRPAKILRVLPRGVLRRGHFPRAVGDGFCAAGKGFTLLFKLSSPVVADDSRVVHPLRHQVSYPDTQACVRYRKERLGFVPAPSSLCALYPCMTPIHRGESGNAGQYIWNH
jgi:hypothetical protein